MSSTDWPLRTTPPERAARWTADGWWNDDTLGQLLDRGLTERGDLEFCVHSATRPWTGRMRDVHVLARRFATGLREHGIGAGDIVAFQLPNCVEAAVVFYATALLGAVVVPIVHFYGPKEVGYILRRTGVKAFVTIDRFGPIDYLAAIERMSDVIAEVDLVVVVGLDQPTDDLVPFDELLSDIPVDGPVAVDPDSPALVAYTSGTTAEPKGVIHSHRTIGAETRQLGSMQQPGGYPTLVGAPVGHAIGMLGALLLPVVLDNPVHLIDVWDPPRILQLMLEHRLSCGSGATFFLTSLLDHPDRTDEHLELMRHTGLGGSAVPAAIAERATAQGISIVRMYGSTEHPSITGATHQDPLEQRIHTDGHPLGGVEIVLVDDDGKHVANGQPGEILSRGPDCFVGYTDPELTDTAFDDAGWFRTGDIGILADDGFLRITDRKKDVIIRGGENISAVEVEEALMQHPALTEVAVVAAPDERLGERVCAMVRVMPGQQAPDIEAVRMLMRDAGLARQKWPEDVRVVDDFPRTPSGKIQKVALRDLLRKEGL
jgi:acyl-CoA synthetase (AMP-forming)/AMP-acid ligase II